MMHVSGRENEFVEIYENLWPQIYRYVYYRVQNAEEAEELTQDVFKRVFKKYRNSKIQKDKVKSYLYITARNIIYDKWRKRALSPNIVSINHINPNDSISENQNMEANMIVKEILDLLDEESRRVIVLRIIKGYSIKRTAEELNKPEGTIKSMQYRALQKLKSNLRVRRYF